ncbi:membrane protein [Mycobacterium sp. SWH-M1]|nr:membrane protein [Mycobacterium sp. SWH-M1]
MSDTKPAWMAPAALVVAVIALALAAWGLLRPSPTDSANAAGAPSSGDAKTEICQAFTTVRNAVSLQTNADLGTDKVARQAVAANARLATLGGGEFLLSRLNSAVPGDLADAVRSFANDLTYIGIGQLAGAPGNDPAQAQRQTSAQDTATKIDELCR